MGRIAAPHGVRGWVRIHPLSAAPGNLGQFPVWQLGRNGEWYAVQALETRVHGRALVARLEGVADRDAAAALKGVDVGVLRTQLPQANEGEFYWVDLIGLRVVAGEHEFGRVARILETGANDVLVIADADGRETLIPFIAGAIRRVDVAADVIEVDWGEDY